MSDFTDANDCNVLRWLAPRFAARVAEACREHDADYHTRRRPRIAADLRWMAAAADVSVAAALFFGVFLFIGSWWLYYDCDKAVERWGKTLWAGLRWW